MAEALLALRRLQPAIRRLAVSMFSLPGSDLDVFITGI
jgi:hypothetical protein